MHQNDKNDENDTDEIALQYFGKGYLKTPRVIIELLFSTGGNEAMIAKLHCLLFWKCNYSDGYICIKGQKVVCCRGEYITSYNELARILGVNSRTVRRYVDVLVSKSLVEVKQVADRVCFRVCGYVRFTDVDTPVEKNAAKSDRVKSRNQQATGSWSDRKVELEILKNLGKTPRFDLLEGL